jgi:hypothetical protein
MNGSTGGGQGADWASGGNFGQPATTAAGLMAPGGDTGNLSIGDIGNVFNSTNVYGTGNLVTAYGANFSLAGSQTLSMPNAVPGGIYIGPANVDDFTIYKGTIDQINQQNNTNWDSLLRGPDGNWYLVPDGSALPTFGPAGLNTNPSGNNFNYSSSSNDLSLGMPTQGTFDQPVQVAGDWPAGGWDDSSGDGSDGPVILALPGNSINITQLSQSNVFFDTTGSGQQNLTAWAGVGNGVLFYDPTGQGKLTQANQYIFTDWDPGAASDMQALEDVFDTNHDGSLSGSELNDFFVMVTNANGTQTVYSVNGSQSALPSLGITSINLNANTTSITLPDGSSIDGETTYTTSGGGSGTAGRPRRKIATPRPPLPPCASERCGRGARAPGYAALLTCSRANPAAVA